MGPTDLSDTMSIPESFRDTKVLITGGTGFMGKVLIEKLLRSCPDLCRIYLLVREKKGKDMHQRLDELFEDPLFSVLKKEQPNYRQKVTTINCDMEARGLALSEQDRKMLIQEISVVFHGAATVRFDEALKMAYNINVRGTEEMLLLAKQMKDLKAFVHLSTAFCNCCEDYIDEKLYDVPIKPARLRDIVENVDDDELLEAILPKLLGKFPNTYTYTKAVAEHIVNDYANVFPIAIFRPAIVVGTANEPIVGWTDNLNGPTGVITGVACGVLRTFYAKIDCIANLVPVDMSVNALIATAWQAMNTKKNHQSSEIVKDCPPKMYNYVSSVEKPLTWGDFKVLTKRNIIRTPPMNTKWYYFFIANRFWFLHILCIYLLHYLPALIIDGVGIIAGGRSYKLCRVYRKIDKFTSVISYFTNKTWTFSNKNTQDLWNSLSPSDQKIFDFNMKQMDWEKYFYNYVRSIRVYMLKDDLSTLPQAMVRWKRLYWAHQTLKTTCGLFVVWISWIFVSKLYRVFN